VAAKAVNVPAAGVALPIIVLLSETAVKVVKAPVAAVFAPIG